MNNLLPIPWPAEQSRSVSQVADTGGLNPSPTATTQGSEPAPTHGMAWLRLVLCLILSLTLLLALATLPHPW
jgi:hypothetical protein